METRVKKKCTYRQKSYRKSQTTKKTHVRIFYKGMIKFNIFFFIARQAVDGAQREKNHLTQFF